MCDHVGVIAATGSFNSISYKSGKFAVFAACTSRLLFSNKKICSYVAQYPVRWTVQSITHHPSGRPVHSDTNSASLGK